MSRKIMASAIWIRQLLLSHTTNLKFFRFPVATLTADLLWLSVHMGDIHFLPGPGTGFGQKKKNKINTFNLCCPKNSHHNGWCNVGQQEHFIDLTTKKKTIRERVSKSRNSWFMELKVSDEFSPWGWKQVVGREGIFGRYHLSEGWLKTVDNGILFYLK